MSIQNPSIYTAITDSPDAYNQITACLKNWMLIGVAAIILMMISLLSIGSFTTKLILLSVQFGIFVISIIYFLKTLKLKKQLYGAARDNK
jgi:hypothetical protein